MRIKSYKSERQEDFKYLGVIHSEDNNNQIDLQERIKDATKIFKNKNLKETNIKTKEHNNRQNVNIRIRNWDTNRERDRKQLKIFERKVYRRILGPVYDNEKENWRILTNKEIYASVKKNYYNRDHKVK